MIAHLELLALGAGAVALALRAHQQAGDGEGEEEECRERKEAGGHRDAMVHRRHLVFSGWTCGV